MTNNLPSFFDRYLAGQHQEVWHELLAHGNAIQHEPLASDAEAVARETMRRVAHNVDVLINRLQSIGYQFGIHADGTPCQMYEGAHVPPRDLNRLASGIERIESEVGKMPLSLRYFAEEVGLVDFRGQLPQWVGRYEYLDPLMVDCLFDSEDRIEDVLETAQVYADEGDDERYVEIAPDYYHKENVSGGAPYYINVPNFSADGPVVNIEHPLYLSSEGSPTEDTYLFVNYLRACFAWGGFPVFAVWKTEYRPLEELEFLTSDLIAF